MKLSIRNATCYWKSGVHITDRLLLLHPLGTLPTKLHSKAKKPAAPVVEADVWTHTKACSA